MFRKYDAITQLTLIITLKLSLFPFSLIHKFCYAAEKCCMRFDNIPENDIPWTEIWLIHFEDDTKTFSKTKNPSEMII